MWQAIILEVCETLESKNIKYHADASSSLFVHGLVFDMKDFDVTIEWSKMNQANELFSDYTPTAVSGDDPQSFQFSVRGYEIDAMSYPSESGIGLASERVQVNYGGRLIWSKTPNFYLQRMRLDHPVRDQALAFFK